MNHSLWLLFQKKRKVILQINQAFLDRDTLQTEALIQPHQIRAFGLVVDNCAHIYMGKEIKPGGQCIEVRNAKHPMHFDSCKCYFQIQKPDHTDLAKYLIIELTPTKDI